MFEAVMPSSRDLLDRCLDARTLLRYHGQRAFVAVARDDRGDGSTEGQPHDHLVEERHFLGELHVHRIVTETYQEIAGNESCLGRRGTLDRAADERAFR